MARRRSTRSRGRSARSSGRRRTTARRSFRGRSAGRTRSFGSRSRGRARGQTVRIEIVQPAANPLGRFLPGVAPDGQMAVATGPKTAKF